MPPPPPRRGGTVRLLIPSELRNPFPSNSLNRSVSSSFSSLPSSSSYRGSSSFSSHLSRLIPHSTRVGIQRPHNRLLTHSIFLLRPHSSSLAYSPGSSFASSSLFIRFWHLVPSIVEFLAASFIGTGEGRQRNAVLPFPRKRNETEEERRCKRRRRELKRGSSRDGEATTVDNERSIGRHADDKEADTMTGLPSARFEYIGSLWRGMNW